MTDQAAIDRNSQSVVGIIPARYGATRFPGKLLADLHGKSVLERTWLQVKQADRLDEVYIAAGDDRIASAARDFGAEVIEVFDDVPSGSDRIWKAAEQLELNGQCHNVVVNVQGDEPFIDPATINLMVDHINVEHNITVVTAATFIISAEAYLSNSVVKVVFDINCKALYFSRSPIPHGWILGKSNAYRHLGIYAYTVNALRDFILWDISVLERVENLEQLRFLENGMDIEVTIVEDRGVGIDTEEDLIAARKLFYNI